MPQYSKYTRKENFEDTDLLSGVTERGEFRLFENDGIVDFITQLVLKHAPDTDLSQDDVDAIKNALSPSADNPFVTQSELESDTDVLSPDIKDALEEADDPAEDNPFITQSVLSALSKIGFDMTADATVGVGEIAWDDQAGTIKIGLEGGTAVLQVGEEVVSKVTNSTDGDIPNGSVVCIDGATGHKPSICLADNTSADSVIKTVAVTTEAIAQGETGFVTTFGYVRGIDTSDFNEGDLLYLDDNGGITNVRPTENYVVSVGIAVRKNPSQGSIFVRILPNMYSDLLLNESELDNLGLSANEKQSVINSTLNSKAAEWDGKLDDSITIREEDTEITLSESDGNTYIRYTGADDITVTVPNSLLEGQPITIVQAGDGVVTLEGDTDVTVNYFEGLKTAGQGALIQAWKVKDKVIDTVGGVE
ncbi:MAG: capsid cement protein [Bacteroidales bacterium]